MIRGMIFDLDGTLLDTIGDLTTASNNVMKEYGFPVFPEAEIMLKVGNGNRNLMMRCLPEGKKELTDEALAKFKKYYAECYMEKTAPYEGVYETVEKLYQKGIKLAVNTNKLNEYCENLIHKNFPGIEFTGIIGNIDGYPLKPDPYAANMLIEKMGLTKEEVVYIGDSEPDMKTARNAGIKSVWVPWGFRSYDQVRDERPDYRVEKPEDLLDLI